MATSQPWFHSERTRLAIQVPRLPPKTYMPIRITVRCVVPVVSGGLTQEILLSSLFHAAFASARTFSKSQPGISAARFLRAPSMETVEIATLTINVLFGLRLN